MSAFFKHRSAWLLLGAATLAVAFAVGLAADWPPIARAGDDIEPNSESQVLIGLAISPVELDLEGKNRGLVGLGSYIVNARGACNDCHTQPAFAPGGNPFLGEPEVINTAGFLGGGRPFGPVIVSRNITPDPDTGLPAGMTFDEFELVMRTGVDLRHLPPFTPSTENDLLQVMPWPVFRNMTDRDLRAIYEYLRAIPSVP